MRFQTGTTDIPIAGTRVQISNTADKVKSIAIKARPTNAGNVFFGISDVASTKAWTLQASGGIAIDFEDGSVAFSTFYVDAEVSGDDIDWAVILE